MKSDLKIHIEGNLYLESDPLQFMIREYSGKFDKDGKETISRTWHYTKLDAALRHLLTIKLKAETGNTLYWLHNALTQAESDINAFCARLDLETKVLRGGETPNDQGGNMGADQQAEEVPGHQAPDAEGLPTRNEDDGIDGGSRGDCESYTRPGPRESER